MKIEAGKYYKTRDGRKVGPMVYMDGCDNEPWMWTTGNGGSWSHDGEDGDAHGRIGTETKGDLIAEWTDNDIGPLAELDVKPGDVVLYTGYDVTDSNKPLTITGKHQNGNWYHDGQTWGSYVSMSPRGPWKLISRAATTPPVDLTAITTPFGLLDKATQDALIAHGGPYEYYDGVDGWLPSRKCNDVPRHAHRVKPGPKRETVTNREMYITTRGTIASNAKLDGARPVTITYDTIDGVIEPATYRVVAR